MRILLFILLLPAWVLAAPVQTLDKVVAVVNDNVITQSELDTQANLLRQQILAKNMPLPEDNVLRKQVLQHLIEVDLQLQLAKTHDINVDATELDATLEKIATDHKMTLTELREAVGREGIDWEVYRDNIRKEMVMMRLQQKAVGKDVVVSTQQVEDYLKTADREKTKQLFHVQNIVIPLPEEPTTEQVKKAHKKATTLLGKIKQGADFSQIAIAESSGEYALEGGDLGERHLAELPEIFANKVIDMKVGEVAGPIRTGNGFQLIKLVSMTENQEHHELTKTHVRHILLKQAPNMTLDEAKRQIDNLYQQLKAGKDFAVMAKQYSLDAASAVRGGDLGWVVAEELVPQFAEAMNALPLHTLSQPVKSPFGWHLIEVLERKVVDDSEGYKRQQIRQLLQQRKFSEAVQNWKQHIKTEAYVNILDKALV